MTVPVVLAFFIGLLQWRSSFEFRASREGVDRSYIVLRDLKAYFTDIIEAETGQRGYLLTQKESYLAPYHAAILSTRGDANMLRRLTADNSEQQHTLDLLDPLLDTKLQELAATIELEQRGDHASAMQIVQSGAGEAAMNAIRLQLHHMEKVEMGVLSDREAIYRHESGLNLMLSGLLLLVGFLFFSVISLLLYRMEKYQDMIKICAWSKMIEHEGEWLTIEEYLTRRLGAKISHGMAKGEAENFLKALEKERLTQKV